ncbi:MAG: TetR/AcrR family transcriptional regulator [Nitratireductor sp.]|jgi:AcrR family transcriptional regulator|nr:TetR/AcrR family transcriptional regulator [Nitratireductor sp.]
MSALPEYVAPALDARSIEILDRIKGVFSAKGFSGASMQDLARAAEMSVGNFYRYFPSKNAIVEALVALDLARIEDDFRMIMQSADPLGALRAAIRHRVETLEDGEGPLWAEIEAAAARQSEIAAISERMHVAVMENLISVFARISGHTEEQSRERFAAYADLIIILVKGIAMHKCGGAASHGREMRSAELQALVIRQIDALLADIASGGSVLQEGTR